MFKAILGYDIMPGMTVEEYEKWISEIHIPDLSEVQGLRKVLLNKVKDTVTGNTTFYMFYKLLNLTGASPDATNYPMIDTPVDLGFLYKYMKEGTLSILQTAQDFSPEEGMKLI